MHKLCQILHTSPKNLCNHGEKIVIVVLVDLIVYVKKERKERQLGADATTVAAVTPVGGDTARHGGSLRSTVLLHFFPNHPEFLS